MYGPRVMIQSLLSNSIGKREVGNGKMHVSLPFELIFSQQNCVEIKVEASRAPWPFLTPTTSSKDRWNESTPIALNWIETWVAHESRCTFNRYSIRRPPTEDRASTQPNLSCPIHRR